MLQQGRLLPEQRASTMKRVRESMRCQIRRFTQMIKENPIGPLRPEPGWEGTIAPIIVTGSEHVFFLSMSLAEIPDSVRCDLCEGESKKVLLPYRAQFRIGNQDHFAICNSVPGYRCGNCGDEFHELRASVTVNREALKIIEKSGDQTTAQMFRESIAAGEEMIARSGYVSATGH